MKYEAKISSSVFLYSSFLDYISTFKSDLVSAVLSAVF